MDENIVEMARVAMALQFDLLGREDAGAKAAARAAVRRRANAAIAKPVSVLQDVAKKHPELNLVDDAERLDDPLGDRDDRDPDFKRREALKHLSRLQDALQKKAAADRFQALKETKKRLRRIGRPSDPNPARLRPRTHAPERP